MACNRWPRRSWSTTCGDKPRQPLSRLLMVEFIPHVAIVGSDGKVIYSGNPTEAKLREVLAKIDVTL